MKILVIDDDRGFMTLSYWKREHVGHDTCPHIWISNPEDHDISIARNSQTAIPLLEQGPWDLIFLDHDLGPSERNGLWITRWIAKHADDFKQTDFVVHTMNSVAAPQMIEYLKEVDLQVQRSFPEWVGLQYKLPDER
jgi:CheY-like chemotaxis protein